jgi:hypothetical protein
MSGEVRSLGEGWSYELSAFLIAVPLAANFLVSELD